MGEDQFVASGTPSTALLFSTLSYRQLALRAVASRPHLALEMLSAPSVSVDLVPQLPPQQHLIRLLVEGL